MESQIQCETEDSSLAPSTMNSMENSVFMTQTCLRNKGSEIDILDRTLPIFLKFSGVQFKVKIQTPSVNQVKVVVSKFRSKIEQDSYKHILKGITGSVGPGEVLALMGPFRSGKTTHLKLLSGRLSENVKGAVTYNDIMYNPALKRRNGFVTQDDVLFPQLTVEETLAFAAILRLPSTMSQRKKYQRVATIVKQLGLDRCLGTRIGDGFVKGISRGGRK